MRKHILNISSAVVGLVALSYLPISGTSQTANIAELAELSDFNFKFAGETSGTGKYFEIKDSDYLNVSLQSSETITVSLSSRPKVVSLVILPSSISSAQLTFGGLAPNTRYYMFDNSYKNEATFVSGADGSYSFVQNLSGPHYVWLQETKGTLFIPEDCNTIGSFDSRTSTCTLNQDPAEHEVVEITNDGITLDCNNHRISGRFFGAFTAILLINRQNVTVKNCVVSNAISNGISTFFSNNNAIVGNTTNNNGGTGILVGVLSNANTVSNNISLNNTTGIVVNNASDNIVNGNTAQFNSSIGIAIVGSVIDTTQNTIRGNLVTNNQNGILISGFVSQFNNIIDNTVSGNGNGVVLEYASNDKIINNVISSNGSGIFLSQTFSNTITDNNLELNQMGLSVNTFTPSAIANNKIFHNNFTNNTAQANIPVGGPYFFDNGLPDGGNYWSDFDTPAEGCSDTNNDKLCDTPRIINIVRDIKDNFPWTIRSGWEAPNKVNINLSWSPNEDPDFESYRIFRSTSTGVGLNDTLVTTVTNQNQTSFTDQNLDTGITYFYKVFVFDRAGLFSESNEKSGGL